MGRLQNAWAKKLDLAEQTAAVSTTRRAPALGPRLFFFLPPRRPPKAYGMLLLCFCYLIAPFFFCSAIFLHLVATASFSPHSFQVLCSQTRGWSESQRGQQLPRRPLQAQRLACWAVRPRHRVDAVLLTRLLTTLVCDPLPNALPTRCDIGRAKSLFLHRARVDVATTERTGFGTTVPRYLPNYNCFFPDSGAGWLCIPRGINLSGFGLERAHIRHMLR